MKEFYSHIKSYTTPLTIHKIIYKNTLIIHFQNPSNEKFDLYDFVLFPSGTSYSNPSYLGYTRGQSIWIYRTDPPVEYPEDWFKIFN